MTSTFSYNSYILLHIEPKRSDTRQKQKCDGSKSEVQKKFNQKKGNLRVFLA